MYKMSQSHNMLKFPILEIITATKSSFRTILIHFQIQIYEKQIFL